MSVFKSINRPKIGLALGGGSAKGLAHIGIIKVLEENNIPIDYIAGTSIGALIGGFYAFSKNIKEVEDIALKNNFYEYFSMFLDPSLNQGLIKGEKVVKFIENYIGQATFDSLKIPFQCVSTDVKNGESVIEKSGKVAQAIRTSISIPVFFKPIERDGVFLIDGALSMPVPVQIVRNMGADIVIAVNLYKNALDNSLARLDIFNVADNSNNILLHHLANENVKEADIVISPKLESITWNNLFTPEKTKEAIDIGEEAAIEKIEEIKRLINRNKKENIWSKLRNIFK